MRTFTQALCCLNAFYTAS